MEWHFRAFQVALATLILFAGLRCMFGPAPTYRLKNSPKMYRFFRVIVGLGIIVIMGLAWLTITTDIIDN